MPPQLLSGVIINPQQHSLTVPCRLALCHGFDSRSQVGKQPYPRPRPMVFASRNGVEADGRWGSDGAVGSPRTTGLMSKATSCWCQTGAVRPSPSPYSPPPRRPVSPFPAARVGPCLAACVVTAAAWYRGGQKLRRSTPPSAIQGTVWFIYVMNSTSQNFLYI